MLARYYAYALSECKNEDGANNLFDVLKRKGHFKLLPSILREYEKISKKRDRDAVATLKVSCVEDADRMLKEAVPFMERMSVSKDDLLLKEEPDIVGGFVLQNSGREVDGSYRRKLVELYGRLVSVSLT